jgi:hypothetical protein
VNISESDEFPNPLVATTLEDDPKVTADAGVVDAAPKGLGGFEYDEDCVGGALLKGSGLAAPKPPPTPLEIP